MKVLGDTQRTKRNVVCCFFRRCVVPLLALALTFQWRPAHGQAASATGGSWSPWTMTRFEIQATGAVRLSELFRSMPAVETWSPDRYTLRSLGMGIGGMHADQPAVYLDGVALPATFLDRVLTESLPVSPGDLDAASWVPGLHMIPGGRLAEGRMVLQSTMLTGWEMAGAMALINETGDPGPAKHADNRLNNVDRSGPATWLRLGWGNGRWMIQSGLQTDLHHLTDERISGRIRRTYAETVQPVVTQFSPFVRMRYEGTRWTGHLLSGHSRRKGFIFHEAAGWEWPARLSRTWMAGRLHANLDRIRVALDVNASHMDTGTRPAFIRVPSSVFMEDMATRLSVGTRGQMWNGGGGLGLRTGTVSQGSEGELWVIPSLHAYLGLEWVSGQSQVSAKVLRTPYGTGRDGGLSSFSEWTLTHRGARGGMDLEARYVQGRFPESGQLDEWARAGLDMGEWMILPPLDGNATPRSVDVGVTVSRVLSGQWVGWMDGRIRWMDGQIIPDRVIDQRFGTGPLLPAWVWSSPHSGWLFSRMLGAERLSSDAITWRAFLQFYHVSSGGDDVFFRHQTGFPRHRFWIMASDDEEAGISWMIRAGYVSEWTWPEYREPARRTGPADIVVDASVGKTLFSGYAKTQVSLLNLPDRALGVHPAGVREQLAIRLTLSFSSDRRFAKNRVHPLQ